MKHHRLELGFAFAILLMIMGWGLAMVPRATADDYRLIAGGSQWEVAAPGVNTDALTDITWPSSEACRVTIQCNTSTVANLMVSRGGVENALGLNSNVALTAGAVYTFDVHGVRAGDTVNLQVETDSIIDMLAIGSMRLQR